MKEQHVHRLPKFLANPSTTQNKMLVACRIPGQVQHNFITDLAAHVFIDEASLAVINTETGELVGCQINEMDIWGKAYQSLRNNMVSQREQNFLHMEALLNTCERPGLIYDQFKTDRVLRFHFTFLNTGADDVVRTQIIQRLYEISLKIAKKRRVDLIVARSSSVITQDILEAAHFKTINEVFFRDFENEKPGRLCLDSLSKLASMKLMVKELEATYL